MLKNLSVMYGARVAVGADVRGDRVAVRGWLKDGGVTLDWLCRRLTDLGLTGAIVTDIARDGALRGCNTGLYRRLSADYPQLRITASGGVSSPEDLAALREAGLWGAIVGKAVYTGAVDLARAVKENA